MNNHKHTAEAAYPILLEAGMGECKWIRWDDRLECWWQWVSGNGKQGAWLPITDDVARDLLTMHALRWLVFDNDGAVDAHFWADDGVMLELDGRKKLIGGTHADLLEAIHAAAKAMQKEGE